ncbi:hypothetical protein [Promicromonospora sp. AC04]|uniref:hypothetical protein n=1 Tax=Promicromonospora sp. AC04 TaxID=2135723 RepID=UPI0011B207F3|nr:hypothetical protein [Promicromonospora sp. AC04]
MSTPLGDLQIGDRVVVKRNLDHPAHMKQVPADPRDGGTKWVRDENIDESVAVSTIVERRHHPSVTGRWLARPARTLVRLRSGLWYDLATGLQEGSGATRIERRS